MEKLLTLIMSAYKTNKQDGRSLIERSVSFLLLGLICVFALNSIGNVQQYVGQYHHHWTGEVLGIAFGTVVFVCAYIAATTHSHTRWVAIVLGTVFGIASAQFQTELYVTEGMVPSIARALSYIPILAGEVGLALLESLYSKQHKQDEVAQQLATLQQQLQSKQEDITALQEEIKQQQQPRAAHSTESQPAPQPTTNLVLVPEPSANGQIPHHNGEAPYFALPEIAGDLKVANDVRAAMKEQRKAAIPEILADAKTALSTSELAQRLEVAYGWRISSDSVRRYCQELATENIVENIKRKWQLCSI